MLRKFLLSSALALSVGGSAFYAAAQTPDGSSPPTALVDGATSVATIPSNTADVIVARRLLMSSIGEKTDIFRGYLDGSTPFDADQASSLAGDISNMLLAFPHLFPPETSPDVVSDDLMADPATSTLANSTIWEDFPAFYAEAKATSDLALQMQLAESDEDFLAKAPDLIAACDACHASWREEEEPYEVPIPLQ